MPDSIQKFVDAVIREEADEIRELLRGSDEARNQIDAPVFDHDTPAIVRSRNNREVVDVLLESGADINARSQWVHGGQGVLHNTSPDMARYLMSRGARPDIHSAAALDLTDEVERLLAEDPTLIDGPGPDGKRPLHFASTPGMVELLLAKGADINARCADHQSTPAQYAAADATRCRYLIERGAEPDIFSASAVGDLSLVESILDKHPDAVDAHTPWGFNEDEDGFGYDYPPTPSGTSAHIYMWALGVNMTPHMVAQRKGHDDVVELLLERSSPLRRLVNACVDGDSEQEERILVADPGMGKTVSTADAGALGGRGLFEYHFEKQDDAHGAIRTMVDAGFSLSMKAEMGATPLHWACWYGSGESVNTLLDFGAPLEIRDDSVDSTPLQWAVHGALHGHHSYGEHQQVIRRLLIGGANADEVSIPSGDREIDALVGEYQAR